nr:reverse transcriptase domain-containing protein [Tanacetum cinerariifolium]GEY41303.1 reverse transcriptase domain-containing protein [Tanacetum cinerariifolium]
MHVFVSSKLVANQVEGSYEAKGEKIKKYKEKALEMIRSFTNFQISHIPREENRKADTLSKLAAMQCEGLTKGVLVQEIKERSVDTVEVNAIIKEVTRTWLTPIQEYTKKKILPEDATEARTILKKAHNYTQGGAWVEELPNMLWAHRITPKISNRETPFSIAYGAEAVIPTKIGIPTRRTIQRPNEENKEALRLNLNLLEEQRGIAAIREARQKQQVEKYYNQRVRHKQFKVGEFVLQKNKLSKIENIGKLGPKWEGPYEVVETYGMGAYKLRSMDSA